MISYRYATIEYEINHLLINLMLMDRAINLALKTRNDSIVKKAAILAFRQAKEMFPDTNEVAMVNYYSGLSISPRLIKH